MAFGYWRASTATSSGHDTQTGILHTIYGDLWNPLVDKKEFQTTLKEIYPEWLTKGENGKEGLKMGDSGDKMNYLDMTI